MGKNWIKDLADLPPQVVKNLSTKSVIGSKKFVRDILEESKSEKLCLYIIMGKVHGWEVKESNMGTSLHFFGEFRAYIPPDVMLLMGEDYAPKIEADGMYLPNAKADQILSDVHKENGNEITEFGFQVCVSPQRDDSYVYSVTPLMKPAKTDSLSDLENRLGGGQVIHQIEAPKKEKKK